MQLARNTLSYVLQHLPAVCAAKVILVGMKTIKTISKELPKRQKKIHFTTYTFHIRLSEPVLFRDSSNVSHVDP